MTVALQAYVICPLNFKLNILYSFIKSHLTNKVVVFCSSCKQVRRLVVSRSQPTPLSSSNRQPPTPHICTILSLTLSWAMDACRLFSAAPLCPFG